MNYRNFTPAYKYERMHCILEALHHGPVPVGGLFLEEIRWLKQEFGDSLKKAHGHIYLDD